MTRISRRHTLSCLLATVVLAIGREATPVLAQDGSYIIEPWSGYYTGVAVQPGDQKIVAAGFSVTSDSMAIARYHATGVPDTSYGSGGISTPTGVRESSFNVALQADGKAVVAARTGAATFGAARFKTNGSLDNSFGNGGVSVTGSVGPTMQAPREIGLQSSGKIVVGGGIYDSGLITRDESAVVARFLSGGGLDYGKGGFGEISHGKQTAGFTVTRLSGEKAEIQAIAIQPDDKIVAAGFISSPASVIGQLFVARFSASGFLDTSFNGSGYSVLSPMGISYTGAWFRHCDVALQSDGRVVVVSTSEGIDGSNDMLVARFTSNGALDTTFGGGIGYVRLDVDGIATVTSEVAEAVSIQPDGKIIVVGTAYTSGGPGSVLAVRLDPNGAPDASFGGTGFKLGMPPAGPGYHSFQGSAVALLTDGTIIIAGSDDWDPTDSTEMHAMLMRFAP